MHVRLRACCFDAGTTKDECVGEVKITENRCIQAKKAKVR